VASPGPAVFRGDVELTRWVRSHERDHVRVRRHLHAHPELGHAEHETTELIELHLRRAGLEPTRLSTSPTGLICDIEGGAPGPTVALRADIDALPMADEKQVGHRSTVDGVAHACGHDVHTTILLATAAYLAERRAQVRGTVRLIFQPAEEQMPGGALDVLADGGLDGVDAIVGLHCEPKADVGMVGFRHGAITSASDRVEISLRGPGGHTARPELTVDLIDLAARLVRDLPDRVRAGRGRDDALKLVFGTVHAGNAVNVMPSLCELGATARTPSIELWEQLPDLLQDAVEAIVDGTGATAFVDHTPGVPPVVNDGHVVDVLRSAAMLEIGEAACYEPPQSWGGDDFAWFTRAVPGAYLRLGTHDPASDAPRLDLHAGHFDVDERAIGIGVRMLVTGSRALADDLM
jgi:amidohydrolase